MAIKKKFALPLRELLVKCRSAIAVSWKPGSGGQSALCWIKTKCTLLRYLSLYCPPQCMLDKGDHFEPNLEFCKGCGICVKNVPEKP